MEEENQQSQYDEQWEWTGDFDLNTFELKNEADNIQEYNFENGEKSAVELLNFKTEIKAKYTKSETETDVFKPLFSTLKTEVFFSGIEIKSSEVNITNIDKFETVDEEGESVSIELKTYIKSDDEDPRIQGLNFLSEYVDKFKLPDNFTFDKYDTEDGYYRSGYPLIIAGGNYYQIINQGSSHEIDVVVNITVYDKDPDDENTTEFESRTTSKTFKMMVMRNFSSIRNLFMAKYLDEQILRGDVDHYTYNGIKFQDGSSYLQYLAGKDENGVPNLPVTQIMGISLKSVNGSLGSIVNEDSEIEIGTYFESESFNGETYSSGELQNKNQENENITLYLKNFSGNINIDDVINSNGSDFLVINVFQASSPEPRFSIAF